MVNFEISLETVTESRKCVHINANVVPFQVHSGMRHSTQYSGCSELNELYPNPHLVMVLFELKTRLNCVNLLPCKPTPFKWSDFAVLSVLRFSKIANNDSSRMTLSERSTESEFVSSIDALRCVEKRGRPSRRSIW